MNLVKQAQWVTLSVLLAVSSPSYAENDAQGFTITVGAAAIAAAGGLTTLLHSSVHQTLFAELQSPEPLSPATRQRLIDSGEEITLRINGKQVRTFSFRRGERMVENFDYVRRRLLEEGTRSQYLSSSATRLRISRNIVLALGGAVLTVGITTGTTSSAEENSDELSLITPEIAD